MNIVSIEPTPNPNSMKINLGERLDPGQKYSFTKKDKGRCPGTHADPAGYFSVLKVVRKALGTVFQQMTSKSDKKIRPA